MPLRMSKKLCYTFVSILTNHMRCYDKRYHTFLFDPDPLKLLIFLLFLTLQNIPDKRKQIYLHFGVTTCQLYQIHWTLTQYTNLKSDAIDLQVPENIKILIEGPTYFPQITPTLAV